MKNYIKMAAVLFMVCAAAAASLAFVYQSTKDKIAAQAVAETREALKQVFPSADQFTEVDPGKHWEALKAGTKIGDVLSFIAKGYGGPIKIVLGITLEKKVNGIRIISHSETPGLGAKITSGWFLDQYKGKGVTELHLTKDNGKIDAITASTISSRAVTEAVRQAVQTLP